MTRYAYAVKMNRCIGCHTCSLACKMQNNIPDGMLWNRVLTENCDVYDGAEGTYPDLKRTYLPLSCQHCQNAPCQRVCPTGATYTDPLGRVEINYAKCIGCRMCMAACPYNVRVFNWNEPSRITGFEYGDHEVPARKKGVMEKCTMCTPRVSRGLEPMCVAACPNQARVFGDLDDPESEVSQLLAKGNVRHLLEEFGTDPSIFYVE